MAKKLTTKSQIVSHFAEKFEFSKKMAAGIIEEVEALAVSKTKKTASHSSRFLGPKNSPHRIFARVLTAIHQPGGGDQDTGSESGQEVGKEGGMGGGGRMGMPQATYLKRINPEDQAEIIIY